MSFIALHGSDHVAVFELQQANGAVDLIWSPFYGFSLFNISKVVCVEFVQGVLCQIVPRASDLFSSELSCSVLHAIWQGLAVAELFCEAEDQVEYELAEHVYEQNEEAGLKFRVLQLLELHFRDDDSHV